MSPELVQFELFRPYSFDPHRAGLMGRMAGCRINLPFVTCRKKKEGMLFTFCVGKGDAAQVRVLSQQVTEENMTEVRDIVATVSIFPHRYGFIVPNTVLRMFAERGIEIYALCTSLSSVAFNVNCRALPAVIDALQQAFELPENHAPYQWNPVSGSDFV